MANTNNSDKWYFTKEQLENTPSRKCGYDAHKELSYRQQAANFIQDMGQRLKVSQLCINTAIVYMHRFYVFHSFTHFPWHQMAAAALFLAAKVEEQPRKLEYVIRVANICRNPRDTSIDINSERYITQSQDLVFNENVLLQTLGFDVAIDHPHTHVVRCCHLVRASKDLAQTSYFMASNSLHLTTMCIQYKPTVVACFCILVACKWSNWEIPLSNERREWYSYMDPTVTAELLQQLTEEFLVIFEACPSRLKEKIMAIPDNVSHNPVPHTNSPFDTDPKKVIREDGKDPHLHRSHDAKAGSENDPHKHRTRPHDASSSQHQREREYKERKERERLAAQQKALMAGQSKVPHGHHRPPVDPKLKPHSRPSSVGSNNLSSNRTEPRDILREASRDSPFGLANKEHRDASRDQTKESSGRELSRGESRESSRSDNKDVQKRDFLLKPVQTVQSDINSLSSFSDSRLNYSAEKRVDPNNRSRMDLTKLTSNKHDSVRRHDESKPYLKSETDNIKKHLNASTHDKSSAYLNKSMTATSQKIKSPYSVDASKSVPKQNSQVNANPKPHHNGSSSSSMHSTSTNNEVKIKSEPVSIKDEIPTPPVIKRPSLFSPEKTPPHKKVIKQSPGSVKKGNDVPMISALSPLSSPVNRRSRNYSSSSEPELRPVMKKIDQVEGFENLMRDNTIGINNIHQITDVMSPTDIKKEIDENLETFDDDVKPPAILSPLVTDNPVVSTIVNGLETNPTLISNLLKETPTVPHLPTVAMAGNNVVSEIITTQPLQLETKEKEHHHHKSKKKNKEKHKHKDKDKSKEDREKKKKHKDKDREKHKHKEKQEVSQPMPTEPIKIKIHKDKIQPLPESSVQGPSMGLKIKIPKDKIKTENISELSQAPSGGGLKIKIPKEKINNCNSSLDGTKKRERDRSSPLDVPPSKMAKTNHKESKQNGRHSYNKVSNYQNHAMNCPPPWFPPDMPRNPLPPAPMYPPPPPRSIYYYPQVPPPVSLPNVNVPPPAFMYPEGAPMFTQYYHQGYIYPPEIYQQPPPVPHTNANPPLPRDAPPNIPPPPPPE